MFDPSKFLHPSKCFFVERETFQDINVSCCDSGLSSSYITPKFYNGHSQYENLVSLNEIIYNSPEKVVALSQPFFVAECFRKVFSNQ